MTGGAGVDVFFCTCLLWFYGVDRSVEDGPLVGVG